jgi:hypothetical protein
MSNKEMNVLNETEIEETEAIEKPYTLRRLQDGDLWPVLDIIGKVFPDDLAQVFAKLITGEKNISEIGATIVVKMVVTIIKNMNRVHDEVYDFLSGVSGIPAKDIEKMEFGTTPAMIWDIVKNEKNTGFFKVLSKLS